MFSRSMEFCFSFVGGESTSAWWRFCWWRDYRSKPLLVTFCLVQQQGIKIKRETFVSSESAILFFAFRKRTCEWNKRLRWEMMTALCWRKLFCSTQIFTTLQLPTIRRRINVYLDVMVHRACDTLPRSINTTELSASINKLWGFQSKQKEDNIHNKNVSILCK